MIGGNRLILVYGCQGGQCNVQLAATERLCTHGLLCTARLFSCNSPCVCRLRGLLSNKQASLQQLSRDIVRATDTDTSAMRGPHSSKTGCLTIPQANRFLGAVHVCMRGFQELIFAQER